MLDIASSDIKLPKGTTISFTVEQEEAEDFWANGKVGSMFLEEWKIDHDENSVYNKQMLGQTFQLRFKKK